MKATPLIYRSFLHKALCIFTALILLVSTGFAKIKPIQDGKLQTLQWTIAGKTRTALVYIPAEAKTQATPLIFVFHGHGGGSQNIHKTHPFDKLWPEAISIYPQGLNTVGKLVDPEGNLPGWQMDNDSTNTDLKFFDAMLKTLKTDYKVDDQRIYVTGHSNGGGFTYLLWAVRGDVFAAVAPCASVGAKLTFLLKPKPAFHLLGDTDPLVKPEWQRLSCNYILKLNRCEATGTKIAQYATEYKSSTGNPFIIYDHPGGHVYPLEANQVMIDFFKRQVKK